METTWSGFKQCMGRKEFEMAFARAKRGRLKALVTRSSRRLSQLEGFHGSGRYLGLHDVPIDQIRGTEGRQGDFDIDFYPLRSGICERWIGVFDAWTRGAISGAVQLVQVGGTYFVRDGHHRISVARALGAKTIEAEVYMRS